MIYAITGKPGAGKSFQLVRLAKKFLEKGLDVYSNVLIDETKLQLKKRKKKGNLYYWDSLAEFRYIHNGIVLFDEAGAFFEPREWAKFSPQDRVKFQQHRKQKLDIYLTVQDFSRVDAIVRQLTNVVYVIKNIGSKIFIVRGFHPEDYDLKKRKSLGTSIFFFDKAVANAYDTFQMVNVTQRNEKEFRPMSSFFVPSPKKIS